MLLPRIDDKNADLSPILCWQLGGYGNLVTRQCWQSDAEIHVAFSIYRQPKALFDHKQKNGFLEDKTTPGAAIYPEPVTNIPLLFRDWAMQAWSLWVKKKINV